MIQILRAKIHNARVTQAEQHYEGSFGIDSKIAAEVGLIPYESIDIYNITNGQRIRTYYIPMPEGSRAFQSNGAAAHRIREGDHIIIASYCWLTQKELESFRPKIAIMEPRDNSIKKNYQPELSSSTLTNEKLDSDIRQLGNDRS